MAGKITMILLDTCGLFALQAGGEGLSDPARRQLDAVGSRVCVSAISAFEIGIKAAAGKLILPREPGAWFDAMLAHHQLEEIPVNARIASMAAALPPLHKDPFDRLIIATALQRSLQILTSDGMIAKYPGVATLW